MLRSTHIETFTYRQMMDGGAFTDGELNLVLSTLFLGHTYCWVEDKSVVWGQIKTYRIERSRRHWIFWTRWVRTSDDYHIHPAYLRFLRSKLPNETD